MVSEKVKSAVYVVAAVSGIGIVAWSVYTLFTGQQTKGGSCTSPGTPCYDAIQPYVQLEQQCANEYADLMTQIVKAGQAPTASQTSELQTLQQCMNSAADQIAKLTGQFVEPSFFDQTLQDIFEVVLVVAIGYVVAKYGLPSLGNFINNLRRGGQLTTKSGAGGAGIAALMYDGILQFGAANSLLSATQIAAWQSAVQDFSTVDVSYVSSFYNTLVNESVIDQALANSLAADYANEINVDAASTVAALTPLIGYPALNARVLSPSQASTILTYPQACGSCY